MTRPDLHFHKKSNDPINQSINQSINHQDSHLTLKTQFVVVVVVPELRINYDFGRLLQDLRFEVFLNSYLNIKMVLIMM